MTCFIPQNPNRFAAIITAGVFASARMNQMSVQRWQKHQPSPGFQA